MSSSAVTTLANAMRSVRRGRGLSQETMAEALGISRKTYVRFENCRWFPSPRERAHFVAGLRAIEPALADAMLMALDPAEAQQLAPGQVSVVPASSDLASAFEVAVYATAEELDSTPKEVRRIAAALLRRLANAGVSVPQAASLAEKAVARGKAPGAK